MSKKLKFGVILLIAVITCVLLAILSSAATYTASFANINNGGYKSANNIVSDENGVVTLRDEMISTADGVREFYGWFTEDGTFYGPGAQVTLTKDTRFREAFAYPINTLDDFNKYFSSTGQGKLLRLKADIEFPSGKDKPGSTSNNGGLAIYVDMNGHTITVTGTGNAFQGKRLYPNFFNSSSTEEGKIIAEDMAPTNAIFNLIRHGSNDGKLLGLYVGKNVYIKTTGALTRASNDFADIPTTNLSLCPNVQIWGTVVADSLVNANKRATCLANIDIYSGAKVTLTGETWWTNPRPDYTVQFADLHIEDGATLITTNPNFNWVPSIPYVFYNVEGGLFNVKPQYGMLKNGYEAIFDEQTRMYDVTYVACTKEGSNGVHSFVPQEYYQDLAPTCTSIGFQVKRCACGSEYIEQIEPLGHDFSKITIKTPATTLNSGIKVYDCARCEDPSLTYEEAYVLDASAVKIELTVKAQDGTNKVIVVPLEKAYNLTQDGNAVIFNGVMSEIVFGEEKYTKESIVRLRIPNSVTIIASSAINGLTLLEEIVIDDGANITFSSTSIKNCSALEKLTAGECSLIFKANTIEYTTCANFATLDLRKANATFEKESFKNNSAVNNLLLSAGHTYSFGEYAFGYSGLKEVIIPDNSTVTLGKKCFAETQAIEYIYVGANCGVKRLEDSQSIFGGNSNLKKIVFMDIEYIGIWDLSCKKPGDSSGCWAKSDLEVYIHSQTVEFGEKGVFNYRNGNYKVMLYIANEYTGLPFVGDGNNSAPNLIIYKGIPHKYVQEDKEATCIANGSKGYSTDCPCGNPQGGTYTVEAYSGYTGDTTGGTITLSEVIPMIPHNFTYAEDTIVGTIEATCVNNAAVIYKCTACDATETKETQGTATGHGESDEWEILIKETCITDGARHKICPNCSETMEVEVVKATGHTTPNNWTIVREASCTVGQVSEKRCTVCNELLEREETEPNGHQDGEWQQIASATCDSNGLREMKCSVCNVAFKFEAIVMLGHNCDVLDGATVIAVSYKDGFDKPGYSSIKCTRCDFIDEGEADPIFTAVGYSVGPDGTSIKAGFLMDTSAVAVYKALYPTFDFGVVVVNALTVNDKESFFDGVKLNENAKGFQLSITDIKYVSWNTQITGFTAKNASSLNLVMGIYVVGHDGKVTVIQYADADRYATMNPYADMTLNSITFNDVRVAHGYDPIPAPPPANSDEE